MMLDLEEYQKLKKENVEDAYYILENFLEWYPEIKDRLSDAENAIFQFLIEKARNVLANRQT